MPLPDPAALAAGAAALGCPLADSQAQQLRDFLALLSRWNKVYNLTAVRDDADLAPLHALDSLSIVPLLDRHAAGRALRVLDVGSGGGLPGVVVAVARPDWSVGCVDAVAKKARFVQQAALELRLPRLQAVHGRVERLPPQRCDVVVSRAFASLADFCAWTRAHLADSGVWLAMKGRAPQDEIDALPDDVEMFHVEPLQVPGLDAERCAVWMRPRATAQSPQSP